jgi:hypothetical protein
MNQNSRPSQSPVKNIGNKKQATKKKGCGCGKKKAKIR